MLGVACWAARSKTEWETGQPAARWWLAVAPEALVGRCWLVGGRSMARGGHDPPTDESGTVTPTERAPLIG